MQNDTALIEIRREVEAMTIQQQHKNRLIQLITSVYWVGVTDGMDEDLQRYEEEVA